MIKIKNKDKTPDSVIYDLLQIHLSNGGWDKLEVPFWEDEYKEKAIIDIKDAGYSFHIQSLNDYNIIHIYD